MATVNASMNGLQVLQSTGEACLPFIIIYYQPAVLPLLLHILKIFLNAQQNYPFLVIFSFTVLTFFI